MGHRVRRAVVVGGGFAGMAAAAALARRGVSVTLIEERPRLGGRAYSRTDPRTGDEFDNGQHVFTGACTAIVELCDLLGSRDRLATQDDLRIDFVDVRGGPSALACPPLPAPWHLLAGLLRLGGLSWADRWSGLRMGGALRSLDGPASAAALDTLTCEEWFDRARQPESLRRHLWRPLGAAIVNEPTDRASALPLARVLAESFLGARTNSRMIVPAMGLSRLFEPALPRFLAERGGEARTGIRASRLHTSVDAVDAVETSGGETLPADAVVAAVPHWRLPDLLPDGWRARAPFDRLPELGSAPIVSVHLWMDRRVMTPPFLGLLGTEAPWVFNREAVAGDVHGHALSVVYSAAHAQVGRDGADLVESALADLRRGLPGAREARCIASRVVKERRATFSARPGTDALRPGPVSPLGGLYLAGDWTATGLPATIESAVRSGFGAADAVLRDA